MVIYYLSLFWMNWRPLKSNSKSEYVNWNKIIYLISAHLNRMQTDACLFQNRKTRQGFHLVRCKNLGRHTRTSNMNRRRSILVHTGRYILHSIKIIINAHDYMTIQYTIKDVSKLYHTIKSFDKTICIDNKK